MKLFAGEPEYKALRFVLYRQKKTLNMNYSSEITSCLHLILMFFL